MASNEHHNEVRPIMDPTKNYEEINSYVIFWGLFFAALFALAVGYLCLKIGQTVDAFAPVSILSMGMAVYSNVKMLSRKPFIFRPLPAPVLTYWQG